jgi:selenoprotein W-related protein
LVEEIKNQIKEVNIEYIKSSGGVFEVLKDGNLIFSKRREGRFPDSSEILKKLV